MPEEVQRVIGSIESKSHQVGHIFYPDTTVHWKFGLPMSLLVLWMTYMIGGGVDGWQDSWRFFIEDRSWTIIIMPLFGAFLLYYTAYTLMIAPWWVGKHPNRYFIYIGKEGVIKKNLLTTAYMPWNIVTGANLGSGMATGSNPGFYRVLDIHINRHTILTPRLLTSYAYYAFIYDIAEYTRDDMKTMATLINNHIKH